MNNDPTIPDNSITSQKLINNINIDSKLVQNSISGNKLNIPFGPWTGQVGAVVLMNSNGSISHLGTNISVTNELNGGTGNLGGGNTTSGQFPHIAFSAHFSSPLYIVGGGGSAAPA